MGMVKAELGLLSLVVCRTTSLMEDIWCNSRGKDMSQTCVYEMYNSCTEFIGFSSKGSCFDQCWLSTIIIYTCAFAAITRKKDNCVHGFCLKLATSSFLPSYKTNPPWNPNVIWTRWRWVRRGGDGRRVRSSGGRLGVYLPHCLQLWTSANDEVAVTWHTEVKVNCSLAAWLINITMQRKRLNQYLDWAPLCF